MEKKKISQAVILLLLCCFPFLTLMGCGSDSCIRCTACGDDDTRMLIYASGTDANGVEYLSCVGPAGIFGFGVDSKCWPTECVYVKKQNDTSLLTGCVSYYNETGCISNTKVKSNGEYQDSYSCLGISCFGTTYQETVAESTRAAEGASCLGMSCGGSQAVTSRNYNAEMPRMFQDGCWTN